MPILNRIKVILKLFPEQIQNSDKLRTQNILRTLSIYTLHQYTLLKFSILRFLIYSKSWYIENLRHTL